MAAILVLGVFVSAPSAVQGEPNCTCRYAGQTYAVASCVCIVTPNGARMACCGKVLNNTSWKFMSDICPIAIGPDHPRAQSVAGQNRPAVQEMGAQNSRWQTAAKPE